MLKPACHSSSNYAYLASEGPPGRSPIPVKHPHKHIDELSNRGRLNFGVHRHPKAQIIDKFQFLDPHNLLARLIPIDVVVVV